MKALRGADHKGRAGSELLVENRGGDRACIPDQRALELGVLGAERGDPGGGIDRANADEDEIGTHRRDLAQRPPAERGADMRIDAAADQPQREVGPSRERGGDRRIMRRDGQAEVLRQTPRRREIGRARVDEHELARRGQRRKRRAERGLALRPLEAAGKRRARRRRDWQRAAVDAPAKPAPGEIAKIAAHRILRSVEGLGEVPRQDAPVPAEPLEDLLLPLRGENGHKRAPSCGLT